MKRRLVSCALVAAACSLATAAGAQATPVTDGNAKPAAGAKPTVKVATPGKPTGKPTDAVSDGVMRYPPSSVRPGLIAGGSAVFATAYGLSLMSALVWDDVPGADALLIPVAGPWISLAQNECSAENPDCGALLVVRAALLVVDGLAQLGGLGIVGEGIFMTTEAEDDAPKTSWTVTPAVSPTQTGVSIVGTF